MAIGDAVAAIIGTAATNRQPSSGVEEQISSIIKDSDTDAPAMYDGSVTKNMIGSNRRTELDTQNAVQWQSAGNNMAYMITNSVYFRKPGSTDTVYIGGVQTNA